MKKRNIILVSGSISYDRIMNFPGKFKDHILPEKIHILNVSFGIDRLKESFGGTGGNIVYNLSLLGEKPILLGVVGEDFYKYKKWLIRNKIDYSHVKQNNKSLTAGAYIMTDQDDNQITGFYGGPMESSYCNIVKKIKNVDIAIIGPDAPPRMRAYVKLYKELKIPYIFDPGQQITSLNKRDLKAAVSGARVLICNDYEMQLITESLGLKQKDIEKKVEILVVTKGGKGSVIYSDGKKIIIPPARPKNTSDPTGAGDAYRSGLIKGLLKGWPLEKIGRLAGLVSVYTVEKCGTQTHEFTWKQLKLRYKNNYKQNL